METNNATKELILNDERRKIRIGVEKAAEKAKKVTSDRRVKAPLSVEEKVYFNCER